MKKYKSSVQRLNESRKAYRSILSERVTDGVDALERINSMQDTDMEELGIKKPRPVKPETPPKSNPSTYNEITLEPCPNNTSAGGFFSYTTPSMTIGGNTPTVGMVANLDTNPLSTFTGNWEVTAVNQTSQTCNHSSNVGGICNFDVGTCGSSTTCDFPTISAGCASTADLTNQFVNSPSQFLSNMATWYANPPGPNDGCHFLEVVRQKHLGHLSTGIAINNNNPSGIQMGPAWISQKTSKVTYLDCVLADLSTQGCCDGTSSSPTKGVVPQSPEPTKGKIKRSNISTIQTTEPIRPEEDDTDDDLINHGEPQQCPGNSILIPKEDPTSNDTSFYCGCPPDLDWDNDEGMCVATPPPGPGFNPHDNFDALEQ